MADEVEEDEAIHNLLSQYFAEKHDGTMVLDFLLHVSVMDKEGDRMMWTLNPVSMDLTHKMGIAAFLVEHFRGQVEHMREE